MYNFQTATQIVHALQLPSIERLKKTWSKVPSFETRLYSQLKFFCSPLRDFRLLREATEALASQWGPPGQEDRDPDMTLSGIPGALPFFGERLPYTFELDLKAKNAFVNRSDPQGFGYLKRIANISGPLESSLSGCHRRDFNPPTGICRSLRICRLASLT